MSIDTTVSATAGSQILDRPTLIDMTAKAKGEFQATKNVIGKDRSLQDVEIVAEKDGTSHSPEV